MRIGSMLLVFAIGFSGTTTAANADSPFDRLVAYFQKYSHLDPGEYKDAYEGHQTFAEQLSELQGKIIARSEVKLAIEAYKDEARRRLEQHPDQGVVLLVDVRQGAIANQVVRGSSWLSQPSSDPHAAMRASYLDDLQKGKVEAGGPKPLLSSELSGFVWFYKNPKGELVASINTGEHAMALRDRAYEEARDVISEPPSTHTSANEKPGPTSGSSSSAALPSSSPVPHSREGSSDTNDRIMHDQDRALLQNRHASESSSTKSESAEQPKETDHQQEKTEAPSPPEKVIHLHSGSEDDDGTDIELGSEGLRAPSEDGLPPLSAKERADLMTAVNAKDLQLAIAIIMKAENDFNKDPANATKLGGKIKLPDSEYVWTPAIQGLQANNFIVKFKK